VEGKVELLTYGAGSESLDPAAMRLPDLRSRSPLGAAIVAVRFLSELRSQHYDAVVVAQPNLERSRARGLFMFLPYAVGARRPLLLNPETGAMVASAGRFRATADFSLWAILHAGSALAALAASHLLPRAVLPRRLPLRFSTGGSVTYLRTDTELVDAPLAAGGSVAHTVGVIAALARKGYPVEFWSTGVVAGIAPSTPRRLLSVVGSANTPREMVELVSGIKQILSTRRSAPATGFVYQRYSLNNLLGVALARRWSVPFVLEANASEVSWRQRWSSLSYPRLAVVTERIIFRSADRIAAVSENAAREIIAAGADPDRVRVVPNGVDADTFHKAEPTPLPFADSSFVIAFAGLFYPWHGVQCLARAFINLVALCPDARLLLVGDGAEAPMVRAILSGEESAGRALMTGIVDRRDVPGYLAAADVLVSPHAPDPGFIGSPIKLFEYMATGKPIVASDVGQIGEVLRDGETALLVPPGDELALAGALRRLHDAPCLRAQLGDAAYGEARRDYSWDARLAALLEEPDQL
jgi:glycosyltransferase involved in cell wall biosynthesis